MFAVLKVPGALPLFVSSCVARLPMGALGLLLVLHTRDLTGSYARGGLAAGVYGLALGLSAPVLARMVDRRGQTRVLCIGALVEAGAITTLALLPGSTPFGAILAAALVAGIAQPPTGACMRALWPELAEGDAGRHAAFSLEGVVLELVYITGPVAIVAGIGSWSLRAALGFCAVVVVLGNFAFALNRVSRDWQPHSARPAGFAGPLAGGGVRVLVAVMLLAGIAIGAIEVAVPAMLDDMGHRDLAGLAFGFWGLGSMIAGVAIARAGPADDPARRLAFLLVLWGLAHGAVGLAGSPPVLGLLLLAAGLSIAPTLVSANGMLDRLAPRGTMTEAFTWISTGLTAGMALGAAAGGALTDAVSPGAAMGVLGAAGLIAAAIVALTARGALRPSRPAAAAVRA